MFRSGIHYTLVRAARRVAGGTLRRCRNVLTRSRTKARSLRLTFRRMAAAATGVPPFDRDSLGRGSQTGVLIVSGEPHTPGHRYRVERHARAASDNGFRVTVRTLEEVSSGLDVLDDNVAFVVLWRVPWSPLIRQIIARARRHRAVIIFDVDDLMTVPEFATMRFIDGIRTQRVQPFEAAGFFSRILQTARACDACCCPTESLAQWLRMEGLMTFVIPNGFSEQTLAASRRAVGARRLAANSETIRIGYAAGSFTHQRDFAIAVPALVRLLGKHSCCRLVLFEGCTDISEFPELAALERQVEWRRLVPLEQLPEELARFDINIAPLQMDSPFCDAKSALKFFEAALVGVPTVASPTSPYLEAVVHRSTGLLARTDAEWYEALNALVDDQALRRGLALKAYVDVLWRFGPTRRAQLIGQMYRQLGHDSRSAAEAFQLAHLALEPKNNGELSLDYERVLEETNGTADGEVTVVVSVHNYDNFLQRALDSVAGQTLAALDLVIVDDASTDHSLQVATSWAREHRSRFRRIAVLRYPENVGLAAVRNLGFLISCTPYVLPLDADNALLPTCCERLLSAIRQSGASFAFPRIREFGGNGAGVRGVLPYNAQRLVGSNYIDAMALISLEAWASAGGYGAGLLGWEDYDLWCAMAERGIYGVHVDTELAIYRVHEQSMTRRTTDNETNARRVREAIAQRHRWVHPHPVLQDRPATTRRGFKGSIAAATRAVPSVIAPRHPAGTPVNAVEGRRRILGKLLRCPRDLGRLAPSRRGFTCATCAHTWPVVDGCPVLFDGLGEPRLVPFDHVSNPVPARAVSMIESASGWVLNLSAGATEVRRDRVIEVEASIFRHTDVIADAHRLPFEDGTFDAVIALNCFEHFHSPVLAAAEISRVLRPGGSVLIHTAFLQPLHEAPAHFYNVTSFGLRQWFDAFEIHSLSVTDNFNPIYALSWTTAEVLESLRRDVSPQSAIAFGATTLSDLAAYWHDATVRDHPRWTPLFELSDASRERTAAGFELVAHRPRVSD